MKALSVHPYYAHQIVTGVKSVECRTWKTDYRGDIVICSTAKKFHDCVSSHALGVVELVDVVPFTTKHLKAACMEKRDMPDNAYAWILSYNRLIVPVPVKGKLSLWEYDGKIEYIPDEEWIAPEGASPEEIEEHGNRFFNKYWKDIAT